ncbi:Uncharacterized protein conserved in bacteria [Yersinia enterocolitica]|nr:Uncharacterized protein conserved in bacteria [Yersinia enterocolitica]
MMEENKSVSVMFTFIELSGFSKRRQALLTDDEFREFQETIINDPEVGDTIAGTGGFRKVRWNRQGMGKRGGVRIIYYTVPRKGRIYLALVYPKNEQDNLTEEQKKALKLLSDKLC